MVANTIKNKEGAPIVDVYIPRDSKIYEQVSKGEVFYGTAFVEDGSYITSYVPMKDDQGKIVGAIYTGIVASALEAVKTYIREKKVYGAGYYYVLDAKGTLVVHPNKEGQNLMDSKDGTGRYFIKEIVESKNGMITYPWPDSKGVAQEKIVAYRYIEDLDWVVAVGAEFKDAFAGMTGILSNILIVGIILITLSLVIGLELPRAVLKPINKIRQVQQWLKRARSIFRQE